MTGRPAEEFYIVDIRPDWKSRPYVSFWRPNNANYAYPLAWGGRYSREQIEEGGNYYAKKESGRWHRFPVRCADVEALAIPKPAPRIIDGDTGPVVPQTREIVAKLKACKFLTQKVQEQLANEPPRQRRLTLKAYLAGLEKAVTAEELEVAVQAPRKPQFSGPTWTRISKVRIAAANRIVDAHPHCFYIPRLRDGRKLHCCGQTYRVARGTNASGSGYAWHAAGCWAIELLRQQGFGIAAAHKLWGASWYEYPHRSIALVEEILAGGVPDPIIDMLIKHERSSGGPVSYSLEENQADGGDRRAHQPCPCGGTLFDWGGGHSVGFEFINWHCNKCPDVFTEYMTRERFYELRQRRTAAPNAMKEAAHA